MQINASREELKYNEGTKVALIAKFNALVDEYVKGTLDEIEAGSFNPWEKRLKGQVLHRLNLPMPKLAKELFVPVVSIKEPPKTFVIQRYKNVTNAISIVPGVTFLMQDDKQRLLRGFELTNDDYVVKPLGKHTLVEVRAELDAILAELGMTGVPIKNLSERPWQQPYRKGGGSGAKSEKHKVAAFKLVTARTQFFRPWSNNWEVETERTATEDDVYVILTNFQSGYDFYSQYTQDRRVAKVFGLDMPDVYGYKSTSKKPVFSATGIEYREWRKQFIKDLHTDRATEIAANWAWAGAATRSYYSGYHYYDTDLQDKAIAPLSKALGDEHLITQFAARAVAAQAYIKKEGLDEQTYTYLEAHVLPKSKKDEVKDELQAILDMYPLLTAANVRFTELWGNDSKKWLHYIKLVDESK